LTFFYTETDVAFMTYLFLDSSSEQLILGLGKEGTLCQEKKIFHEQRLTERFIFEIEDFLKEAGENLETLAFVGCGIGPGSYTGTRIGLICAKTLAYSRKLPLLSFYSFLARIPSEEKSFLYVYPLKKGFCLFHEESMEGIMIDSLEEVESFIKQRRLIVHPKCKEQLCLFYPNSPFEEGEICLNYLSFLLFEDFLKGTISGFTKNIAPIYL
jgi:tRNA A37 threonylcarbamoyladenosine modification protein TsaB